MIVELRPFPRLNSCWLRWTLPGEEVISFLFPFFELKPASQELPRTQENSLPFSECPQAPCIAVSNINLTSPQKAQLSITFNQDGGPPATEGSEGGESNGHLRLVVRVEESTRVLSARSL